MHFGYRTANSRLGGTQVKRTSEEPGYPAAPNAARGADAASSHIAISSDAHDRAGVIEIGFPAILIDRQASAQPE